MTGSGCAWRANGGEKTYPVCVNPKHDHPYNKLVNAKEGSGIVSLSERF